MYRKAVGMKLFVVACLVLVSEDQPQAAEPLPNVSKPRSLETPQRFEKTKIVWEALAFRPDGLALAADGEVADERGLQHFGMTRETREYMQVWDLNTYRAYETKMLSDNRARRMMPRFSKDGKILYASARENMMRDWIDNEKDGKGGAMYGARISSQVLLWALPGKTPNTVGLRAAPDGVFIASHMIDNQKMFLVQASEGIQAYDVQVVPGRGKAGPQVRLSPNGTPQALPGLIGQPATFSPDGAAFVARAAEGAAGVVIWDVAGKKQLARLAVPPPKEAAKKKAGPSAKDTKEKGDAPGGGYPKIEMLAVSNGADVVAFVAAGPRARGVVVYDTKTEKVIDRILIGKAAVTALSLTAKGDRLLYIAGGKAVVRAVPQGSETTLPAEGATFGAGTISPNGRSVAAAGTDGVVRLWTFEEDRVAVEEKPGTGSTKIEPIPTAVLPNPLPATPEQIELYHLTGLRRLLGIALELANDEAAKPALAEVRRQATERQAYLRTHGRPTATALADLYGELDKAVGEIGQAADTLRGTHADMNRLAIQAGKEKASENTNRMLNAYLGLMTAMAGSLQGKDYVGTESRGNTTVHLYRAYDLFPGWAEAGTMHMVTTLLESDTRRARMAAVEAVADIKTRTALSAAMKQRDAAADRISTKLEDFATKNYSLRKPDAPSATPVGKQPDPAKMAGWMEEEAKRVRTRSGRDDPFARADILMLRAATPSGKPGSAAALHKLAQDLTALVPLVPTGKVHDADRARLLGMAASATVRAVTLEAGKKNVTEAKNEKAGEAVKLLSLALRLHPDDPSGLFREQLALALAQSGQVPQALEVARRAAGAKAPASTVFTLARLECASGDTARGLDRLEEAIKKGYRNIVEARTLPDFPAAHPRFRDLTTISVKASGFALSQSIGIRNASWFPLKDVTFRVRFIDTFNHKKVWTSSAGLGNLAPGETFMLMVDGPPATRETTIDGKRTTMWIGSLVVSAPGLGVVEVPITDR